MNPKTKPKITLRPQKLSDAKRFYEILSVKDYPYFKGSDSLEDQINYMKDRAINEKKFKLTKNYSILLEGKVVGACGVKIDYHRPFLGEIGYFIDKEHWGKGIATEAVRQLEKICFNELKLKRIEIRMNPKNCPSERIAIKLGYTKEGFLKKSFKLGNKFHDDLLYAKVK
ncbi:MAG: GNAT family N-acetyltransferase [Candidatus Nanoarchaeia archaeon]